MITFKEYSSKLEVEVLAKNKHRPPTSPLWAGRRGVRASRKRLRPYGLTYLMALEKRIAKMQALPDG